MRAHEFLKEYSPPALINKTVDVDGIQLSINADGANVTVYALSDGRQLGYVVFDRDGKNLVADDLAIEERYQGQGIAKIMYDYVKHELGFNIERSWDQTDAGKGFWDKHRGEDATIWEEEVVEDIPTGARAPLYHSTRAYRGLQILKDKAIKPGRDGYVSLTRDYNLNYRELGLEEDPHVTFVIDQTRLQQQQQLKPYSYVGTQVSQGKPGYDPEIIRNRGGRIESEEHTKLPVPLNTVTGVIVNTWELDNDENDYLKLFIQQCEQLGIPVKVV